MRRSGAAQQRFVSRSGWSGRAAVVAGGDAAGDNDRLATAAAAASARMRQPYLLSQRGVENGFVCLDGEAPSGAAERDMNGLRHAGHMGLALIPARRLWMTWTIAKVQE